MCNMPPYIKVNQLILFDIPGGRKGPNHVVTQFYGFKNYFGKHWKNGICMSGLC